MNSTVWKVKDNVRVYEEGCEGGWGCVGGGLIWFVVKSIKSSLVIRNMERFFCYEHEL